MAIVKATPPPKDFLSPRKMRRAIDTALGRAAILGKQELEGATRGWSAKNRPRFTISGSGDERTVTTDSQIFKWQDEGTKPHVILPRRKRALFWKGARHPVRRVNHPGTKAQDFTGRAKARMDREFQRLMDDELARATQ